LKSFVYEIPEEQSGLRLDKILSTHPEIRSRAQAEKLFAKKLITVDGKTVKPSYKASTGEQITFSIPERAARTLEPENIPLEIVFEDEHLLVVNKQAGLVVHPAAGHYSGTLVNALLYHTSDLSMGFNEQRPGIVHRLDRDTSGLLVVAKNNEVHQDLALQFKNRTIHRIYHAIIYGQLKNNNGTVTSYLARHPTDRKRFASVKAVNPESHGKKAITHYKFLKNLAAGVSLIQCKLETGRTHQIRVHVSELGHPIVGDQIYGSNSRLKSVESVALREQIRTMKRIGLHAAELGFIHPKTKINLSFAAAWPKDLQFLIKDEV